MQFSLLKSLNYTLKISYFISKLYLIKVNFKNTMVKISFHLVSKDIKDRNENKPVRGQRASLIENGMH